jgi:hypothetical protein
MSTDQAREIEELRAQVRELQREGAAPSVRVEGFKGLEELSQAIERNDLGGFIQDRAQPVWLQWGILAYIGLIALGVAIALLVFKT